MRNGERIARLAAVFSSAMILSSCASMPRVVPEGGSSLNKRIGVISIAADYARFGHVGMTVFNNEHHYSRLDEFDLDTKIEAGILNLKLDKKVALSPLVFDRQALYRAYNTRDLDASMLFKPLVFEADLGRIQNDLVRIAASNSVEQLLLVTKAVCPDGFGKTAQSLNGFGLYHGRYATTHRWLGGVKTPSFVTMAYLCADVTLLDLRTQEVIASRRVTKGGGYERNIPGMGFSYWVTGLDGISQEQKGAIGNAFAHLATDVPLSVASLLGVSVAERELKKD